MYFALEPKSRREDLYGFEKEFEKLLSLLKGRRAMAPLIRVVGLRRTGKTSLVKTALHESGLPHFTLNGRAFATTPAIKIRSLLLALERELSEAIEQQKKWRDKLLDFLKGIRWIKVDSKPPWVHFEWERPERELDPLDIVYSLNRMARENRTKFVLFVDEAQEFRKLKGYSLQSLMAYVYDEMENIQMIVAGSQVGLLHDFLAADRPDAPLYGRGMAEIQVPRISREGAADFLTKGFEQVGMKADRGIIELAVEELDGIMGWLTLFGSRSVERGGASREVLMETVEEGAELEAEELENFLELRKQARGRYLRILKNCVRLRRAGWTDLKAGLERDEGRRVADNVFSDLMKNLVRGAFLEKGEDGMYSVPDPILSRAIEKIRMGK
jgi:AAA+ ATPase superfamily predicted ATPase